MTTEQPDGLRRFRERLHDVLEQGHGEDKLSLAVDAAIIILILANVAAFSLETVDSIAARYGDLLDAFNVFSVIVFTIEYAARLWVCVELPPLRHLPGWKARLQFASRPLLIVDLLAILPFYLSALFSVDLRILRVLRLLRFLKVARYSPALQTLGRVIANERRALVGACIIMFALMLFSSTIMYFLEREAQPEAFGSIPAAAWWALATLTTVGFGDVTPVTAAGKFFGGLVMVFGVGMAALPVGILATGFTQEVGKRDFVITWSMVVRVPIFAELKAASIAKVVSHLRTQSYEPGGEILRADEEIQSIFLVASGDVEIEWSGGTAELKAGDYFGESALLDREKRHVWSATALTKCDMLLLDRHDFEHLMAEDKDLREQVEKAASDRRALAQSFLDEAELKKKTPPEGGA